MREVHAETAVGEVLFRSAQAEKSQPSEAKPAEAISPQDIRDLKAQIIATFVDLPRVCVTGRCRRRGRCLVAGAPCLRHHRSLAEDRIADLVWPEIRSQKRPITTS